MAVKVILKLCLLLDVMEVPFSKGTIASLVENFHPASASATKSVGFLVYAAVEALQIET